MSKVAKLLGSLSSILLTVNSVLAADNSVNPTANLGPASGVATDIMTYLKWGAFTVAIGSILVLWIRHNLASHGKKISDVLQIREDMKQWFIMAIGVIVGLIFLFQYAIPKINGYI